MSTKSGELQSDLALDIGWPTDPQRVHQPRRRFNSGDPSNGPWLELIDGWSSTFPDDMAFVDRGFDTGGVTRAVEVVDVNDDGMVASCTSGPGSVRPSVPMTVARADRPISTEDPFLASS